MNDAIFYWLNAGAQPTPAVVMLATFISRKLPLVLDGLLILALVFGSARTRYLIGVTFLAAVAGGVLSWLIGYFFYLPRPFVLEMGTQLLPHKPNAGFPSNHMLFITIMTTAAFLGRRMRVFWCMLPLMLAMGWSRIYVGVHFPRDILGGFVLGVLVTWCVWRALRPYEYKVTTWLARLPAMVKRS